MSLSICAKVFHIKTQKTQKIDKVLTKVAELERIGQYESALECLGKAWMDKSILPDVSQFSPAIAGEFLLRCGSIIGYVGSLRQISTAQDQSKDLLTSARNYFLALYDSEKVAECDNFLAAAYYRKKKGGGGLILCGLQCYTWEF